MLIKNDEALCLQSVHDVSNWNEPFIKGFIYKIIEETDEYFLVLEADIRDDYFTNCKFEPRKFVKQRTKKSTFWKKVEYFPYFYDYFTTMKVMRKQKIQKLGKEWKSYV